MDQGLIATIGAIVGGTIPLGALTFALIRWIDGRHRKDMAVLREDMAVLREEMRAGESRLEARIDGLREDMKATEARLEAGVKEVTKRVANVGDRLSRVEGVIEGALLTNRAPVAESREGAA